MASLVTFVYVSELEKDGKVTQKTQEITAPIGKFSLDDVALEISKISSNHVTFEIDDFENDSKAKFLIQKSLFGKSFIIPMKSYNLQIGNWLDFTDGRTELRRSIYIKGIKNAK